MANAFLTENHTDDEYVIEIHAEKDRDLYELLWWWMHTAFDDFIMTVPKATEYGGSDKRSGSSDLRIIGANLAELLEWEDAGEALLQELGAWFYMQGKIARLISDYHHRREGKPDTWFDATVYSMMARRLQEVGRWP